jgi:hypothetical protein
MPKINWTLDVQITGGPKISVPRAVNVEAYDKIEVDILAATDASTPTTATVDVQPGGTDQVKFLLITSSVYNADLTYTADDTDPAIPTIALDEPQLLMGDHEEGAVGLLGAAPQSLIFSNGIWNEGAGQSVSVQILVGRDAIAP